MLITSTSKYAALGYVLHPTVAVCADIWAAALAASSRLVTSNLKQYQNLLAGYLGANALLATHALHVCVMAAMSCICRVRHQGSLYSWSSTLASNAAGYASRCIFAHDPNRNAGENIYATTSKDVAYALNQASASW